MLPNVNPGGMLISYEALSSAAGKYFATTPAVTVKFRNGRYSESETAGRKEILLLSRVDHSAKCKYSASTAGVQRCG